MKFYEIGCPTEDEYVCEIIFATNYYEALGYFIEQHTFVLNGYIEDLELRYEHNEDHLIETSCIGFPIYKKLKQFVIDENLIAPSKICSVWV